MEEILNGKIASFSEANFVTRVTGKLDAGIRDWDRRVACIFFLQGRYILSTASSTIANLALSRHNDFDQGKEQHKVQYDPLHAQRSAIYR